MQNHRELARDGDFGLLEADPLCQPEPPSLERTPFLDPCEQHPGSLEEVGPGWSDRRVRLAPTGKALPYHGTHPYATFSPDRLILPEPVNSFLITHV